MEATFTLVLEPIEDGWWLASIPEVPGAVSQGATQNEARAMVQDAMRELLAASRERLSREAVGDATSVVADLAVVRRRSGPPAMRAGR